MDRGVILEIIALDGGKNASVYGDVDMKGDSATHFINKSSEGKFIIKLTGGHADFTIKAVSYTHLGYEMHGVEGDFESFLLGQIAELEERKDKKVEKLKNRAGR